MKILDYLNEKSITQTKFAEMIGGFQGDVSAWILGKKPVPVARCKKIVDVSGGEITYQDLRPDWEKYWG